MFAFRAAHCYYPPANTSYSLTMKKKNYCRPDGNIPHDQTNQSPPRGAGATQPCSNTPFHSLSGTNTWSPINGTPRNSERGRVSRVLLVHAWWLHNHTSFHSLEDTKHQTNNLPLEMVMLCILINALMIVRYLSHPCAQCTVHKTRNTHLKQLHIISGRLLHKSVSKASWQWNNTH